MLEDMRKDRLDIIYEDKNIIVINKPTNLLTIGTKDEKINTLYHKVHEYLYKKNKNNKVFIIHRLDKDTSGIVVFAKSSRIKELYQTRWNNLAETREYIAVVEGVMPKKKDRIKEYLAETKTLLTYATTKDKGKLAITNYEVMEQHKNHAILKITIETGRKNQIRVCLANLNHPIIGDKKYGAKQNPLRRVCLHASRLVLLDPETNEKREFIAKIPSQFKIFYEKNK